MLKSPTVFVPEEGPAASVVRTNLQTGPASRCPRCLHSSCSVYLAKVQGKCITCVPSAAAFQQVYGDQKLGVYGLASTQTYRPAEPPAAPAEVASQERPAASVSGVNVQTVSRLHPPQQPSLLQQSLPPRRFRTSAVLKGLGQSLRYHAGCVLGSLLLCSSVEDLRTVKLS